MCGKRRSPSRWSSSRPAGRASWRTARTRLTPTMSRPSSSSTARSEEHTSELQSLTNLVCRLLLEKKNAKMQSERHSRDVCEQEQQNEKPGRKPIEQQRHHRRPQATYLQCRPVEQRVPCLQQTALY